MQENQRNTVIVNKPYQYAMGKLTVGLMLVVTNLLLAAGIFLPDLFGFSLVVSTRGMLVIAAAQVLMLLVVWFVALRRSHRVAGPISVFQQAMQQMEAGDLTPRLSLRKADEFQELSEVMNRAIAAMRDRILCVSQKMDTLQTARDFQTLEYASSDIREILDEFTLVEADASESSHAVEDTVNS